MPGVCCCGSVGDRRTKGGEQLSSAAAATDDGKLWIGEESLWERKSPVPSGAERSVLLRLAIGVAVFDGTAASAYTMP